MRGHTCSLPEATFHTLGDFFVGKSTLLAMTLFIHGYEPKVSNDLLCFT